MSAPKLTPAQATLAVDTLNNTTYRLHGQKYRTALKLLEFGLVEYTSLHHIRLQPGVTRVQHPSGTVWLNLDGEVLAVE